MKTLKRLGFSIPLALLLAFPTFAAQQQQVYVAGAKGVVLNITPNTATQPPVNLTGATVTLVIISPISVRHVVTATVANGGTSATYTTLATDFPTAGAYQLQLVAQWGSGVLISSAAFNLTVSPAL